MYQNRAPALPPWNPAQEVAAAAASEDHRELVHAVRTAFPDAAKMPAHLKTILDKSEQHMRKLLGADMRKCTQVMQKARKQLVELQESKRNHQLAWIAHVTEATKVWSAQMQAYASQQEEFMTKIAVVSDELKAAQASIQELGHQALETPLVKEEEIDNAQLDLQQAKAAQRLANSLAACASTAEKDTNPAAAMEILGSDDEKEQNAAGDRSSKMRKRSAEPAPKASSEAAS